MAFVTKYKLKRVLSKIDGNLINDPLNIHIANKYYYLSDRTTNNLTTYFRFLENPEKFIEDRHLKWMDTKQNAVEVKPAYHTSNNCKALNKRFDNVVLPKKIHSNDELLAHARNIARKAGLYSFNDKTIDELLSFATICMNELNSRYSNLNLKIGDFTIVHNKKNSGSNEYSNLTLQEVQKELEILLKKSYNYFGLNNERKLILPNDFLAKPFYFPKVLTNYNRIQVLKNYRNYLNLINSKESIKHNHTDFSTKEEIVKIAKEIQKFSNPTISAMESELLKKTDKKEFHKTTLEVLGFKPCSYCNKNIELTREEKQYIKKHKIK